MELVIDGRELIKQTTLALDEDTASEVAPGGSGKTAATGRSSNRKQEGNTTGLLMNSSNLPRPETALGWITCQQLCGEIIRQVEQ